jgi:hypothetical protein
MAPSTCSRKTISISKQRFQRGVQRSESIRKKNEEENGQNPRLVKEDNDC